MVWVRFAGVQLIMLVATVLGWVVLIPFCLARAWENQASTLTPGRGIDRWKWGTLNVVYGNPEDGVSGMWAYIWKDGKRVPYRTVSWAPWRAYLWSGWRNSSDNLKYVFSCDTCPLKRGTVLGRPYKIGWQLENGYKVPVISYG